MALQVYCNTAFSLDYKETATVGLYDDGTIGISVTTDGNECTTVFIDKEQAIKLFSDIIQADAIAATIE